MLSILVLQNEENYILIYTNMWLVSKYLMCYFNYEINVYQII